MNWIYDGVEVKELPEGCVGFTYILEYEDGTLYIGKKKRYSKKKKYLSKKELALQTDKRLKTYKEVIKEDWYNYTGSPKSVLVKALKIKEKIILKYHYDFINLTYHEIELQIMNDVLRNDKYRNENIAGNYYRGRIK